MTTFTYNHAQGQLAATAGSLFSLDANTKGRIAYASFNNTGSSTEEITIYMVPSGGSAAGSTAIATFKIPAGGNVEYKFANAPISAGGAIYGVTDTATTVTYLIGYTSIIEG